MLFTLMAAFFAFVILQALGLEVLPAITGALAVALVVYTVQRSRRSKKEQGLSNREVRELLKELHLYENFRNFFDATFAPRLGETMVKEMAMTNLPAEKKETLIDKCDRYLFKEYLIEILGRLDKMEQVDFYQLQKTDDHQKLEQFLAVKVNDHKEIFEDLRAAFKEQMQKTVGTLKGPS